MEITVSIRNVYGNQAIYPVCAQAQLFASIAGTKTLTRQALSDILSLGVRVKLDRSPTLTEALGFQLVGGALA